MLLDIYASAGDVKLTCGGLDKEEDSDDVALDLLDGCGKKRGSRVITVE